MTESWIEGEVRAALSETYRPAPELLRVSMAAIRSEQPRRRSWTWVAGVVAVLLAVGTVTVFVSTRKYTGLHPAAPLVAKLPQPQTVLNLSETPTSGIAYDPTQNVIWLAQTTTGGPDYLDRVDASTGSLRTFLLPIRDFAGVYSQVKVDGAGNVWMSDGYTLLRLDVGTKHVASITLPAEDPDALSGALDPNSASPGTWITAIGIAGDGILVARHNVVALVSFDSSLKQVARFRLPADFAGVTDIYVDQNDRIELLGGDSVGKMLGLFTGGGRLLQTVNILGLDLNAAAGRVVVSGGLDNGALVTSSSAGLTTDTRLTIDTIGSLAAPDPTGGEVLYDGLAHVIERARNGTVIASYSDPRTMICPPQPPGGAGCFSVASDVTALTVDMRGDIWFEVTDQVQEIVAS